MYRFCVFAGTAEGRALVEFLCGQKQASVTACLATEYGKTLLPESHKLTVRAERMAQGDIIRLLQGDSFDLALDATHPYAPAVTENLIRACQATGTDYLRVLRENSNAPENAVFVPDASAAVALLNGLEEDGNVLLATGSKDLPAFAGIRAFAKRVYARVLPLDSSLNACREAGLPPSHILAMQGPFSEELNFALLRAVSAKYLITKDGGDTGGFAEKAAAARKAGVKLIVLGRPAQTSGLSLSDTVALLCQRFRFSRKPRVAVLGIGPGSVQAMTAEVREAMEEADCLIGAKRMLSSAARPGQRLFEASSPSAISDCILSHREFQTFAVLMSGDSGFYSGTKKLLPLLDGCLVRVLPGLSSLAVLCARLRTSYEDVVSVSVHGRAHDIMPDVQRLPRVFALTGGAQGARELCRRLVEAGLGAVTVHIGERLSYPDEKITSGTAAELAEGTYDPLSAVLIENPRADAAVHAGLPDEAFTRGAGESATIPMTKSEVRAVCLSKLRLTQRSVCWDIGAGTGSVSVEMALQARRGQVYAIERSATACTLLEENRRRFSLKNLTVISGSAPEACGGLPKPSHVLIGGSGGRLRELIALLLKVNPNVRVVATAVTLESVAELTACLNEFSSAFRETQAVSLSVARDRKAGPYHLMQGLNPVYIFTMQAGEAGE